MIDVRKYGNIQQKFWEAVRGTKKAAADAIIEAYEQAILSKNGDQICTMRIEEALRCVWVYATTKPYSAESFKRAVVVFQWMYASDGEKGKLPCVDLLFAELYAIKQMDGGDVLRDRVRELLELNFFAGRYELFASALMWMKAYDAEAVVLQHMLSNGIEMSPKAQERLHALTNGRGDAPDALEISSDDEKLHFDVSALAWKDDDYTGFFENLAFKEQALTYALAVRDETKELTLPTGAGLAAPADIVRKMNQVFREEYGEGVAAKLKRCAVHSGTGEETMECILAETKECRQMSVLVYLVKVGKTMTIKFYTLFMPIGSSIAEQKQQAVSLYKNLSPTVSVWENSIKASVLLSIQQMLNAGTADRNETSSAMAQDEPIF